MYLILDLELVLKSVKFYWEFQYEVTFFVVARDMWYPILHVNDDEWCHMILLVDDELPNEVFWMSLCKDDELD